MLAQPEKYAVFGHITFGARPIQNAPSYMNFDKTRYHLRYLAFTTGYTKVFSYCNSIKVMKVYCTDDRKFTYLLTVLHGTLQLIKLRIMVLNK